MRGQNYLQWDIFDCLNCQSKVVKQLSCYSQLILTLSTTLPLCLLTGQEFVFTESILF